MRKRQERKSRCNQITAYQKSNPVMILGTSPFFLSSLIQAVFSVGRRNKALFAVQESCSFPAEVRGGSMFGADFRTPDGLYRRVRSAPSAARRKKRLVLKVRPHRPCSTVWYIAPPFQLETDSPFLYRINQIWQNCTQ